MHGATVAQAATARLRSSLTPETSLPEIAQAIDDALLADLPQLVEALIVTLAQRAATTGDVAQLLQALPPLANVYRYGSVRQTDTALLAGVIDSLVLRAAIGLPVACMAMDEDAAAAMKAKVLAAHEALRLRTSNGEAQQAVDAWRLALRSLAMGMPQRHCCAAWPVVCCWTSSCWKALKSCVSSTAIFRWARRPWMWPPGWTAS